MSAEPARPGRRLQRQMIPTAVLLGAALISALTMSGCALTPPDGDAAARVAQQFHDAVATGGGAAACAVLAPNTVEELESDGTPCAQAVLDEELPPAAAVIETQAFGRQSQVRLAGDVVFLTLSGDDWLVTAAGCTPQDAKPFRCLIKGG